MLNLNDKYAEAANDRSNEMYPYLPYLRRWARGNVLEIGVDRGYSTAALLLGLADKHEGRLWSVDVGAACAKLYAGNPRWTFVHADSRSIEKVKAAAPGKFDLVLIDGYHEHPVVDEDVANYAPLVKPGGRLVLHDIVMLDVSDVYHTFILRSGWQHFELNGQWGLGVAYRP